MANAIVLEDLDRINATVSSRARFEGSTIMVTGCAGFIGFYFMQYLLRYAKPLGIEKVIGLDSFMLDKPDWLSELTREFPNLLALSAFDISRDDIATIKGASTARFVVHAASIASPTFYRQYPLETIDANVWGLRNLLEFYRDKTTLEDLLFFSSSEIYGDPDPEFIPTNEAYRGSVSCNGPRACYDEAKRFSETLCWIYAEKHNMPITVARPFNNYGPGMRTNDKRLPADFAKCVIDNSNIAVLSDGKPTRTFCYVSDAITGYLLCLLHGRYDFFNIGIERPEISVEDLAQIYKRAGRKVFNYSGEIEYAKSEDPHYLTDGPNRRCPVIDKARKKLGYDPRVHVEDGVLRYLTSLKLDGL